MILHQQRGHLRLAERPAQAVHLAGLDLAQLAQDTPIEARPPGLLVAGLHLLHRRGGQLLHVVDLLHRDPHRLAVAGVLDGRPVRLQVPPLVRRVGLGREEGVIRVLRHARHEQVGIEIVTQQQAPVVRLDPRMRSRQPLLLFDQMLMRVDQRRLEHLLGDLGIRSRVCSDAVRRFLRCPYGHTTSRSQKRGRPCHAHPLKGMPSRYVVLLCHVDFPFLFTAKIVCRRLRCVTTGCEVAPSYRSASSDAMIPPARIRRTTASR